MGGLSCDHYPWCIGIWDLQPLPPLPLETRHGTLLLTSGCHHWRPVPMCSLEDLPLPPHQYWHLVVATKIHTVGKQVVCILLECNLVSCVCNVSCLSSSLRRLLAFKSPVAYVRITDDTTDMQVGRGLRRISSKKIALKLERINKTLVSVLVPSVSESAPESELMDRSSALPWTWLLYCRMRDSHEISGLRTVFFKRRLAFANQLETWNMNHSVFIGMWSKGLFTRCDYDCDSDWRK